MNTNKLLNLLTSDKALHFLYCYFLTTIYLPLAVLFALGKEAYDIKKRGFSRDNVYDLVADTLGILTALLILHFLH